MSKIKGKAIIMLLVFITIFNVLNIANFAIWAKEGEIEDILNQIKTLLPNCYVCNLDGKVIRI